jgi:hypothetical protein
MMPHIALDLTALPVEVAVSLAQRKLDRQFVTHLAQQKALMISDGLNSDDVAGLLERQKRFFEADREQLLDELQAWLRRCDNRLH